MGFLEKIDTEIGELRERITKLLQLRDLASDLGFTADETRPSPTEKIEFRAKAAKPLISEEMQKLSQGKPTNAVTQKREYGKSEEHLARIRNIIDTLTGDFSQSDVAKKLTIPVARTRLRQLMTSLVGLKVIRVVVQGGPGRYETFSRIETTKTVAE